MANPLNYYTAYLYYRQLTITAAAGNGIAVGYTVGANGTIDTDALVTAGKMLADAKDVRIVKWDSVQELWVKWNGTSWVEDTDKVGLDFDTTDRDTGTDTFNTVSTKFWFRAQNAIAAEGTDTDYYLVYGDSDSALTLERDYEKVYLLWDDFPGSTLDTTNKWTVITGAVTVDSGNLVLTSTTGTRGEIESQLNRAQSVCIVTKFYSSDTVPESTHFCSLKKPSDWTYRGGDTYGSAVGNPARFTTGNEGVYTVTGLTGLAALTSWHYYRLLWESGSSKLYQDGSIQATHTTNVPTENQSVVFQEGAVNGDIGYVDWVLLRDFTTTEPTTSFGDETEGGGAAAAPTLMLLGVGT